MKKTLYTTLAGLFLLCATHLSAQVEIGTTQTTGINPLSNQSSQARITPNDPNTPQDGDHTLGPVFIKSGCGMNYTTASNKLGQRLASSCCPSTNGVPQPASFTISGIPASATVVQAFIWADASGNGTPATLNITNPASSLFVVPLNVIGTDVDKCWGYAGVYTYRADVTSTISGNGVYSISGFPTNPPDPSNDVDGATMMVIWEDATAGFEGTLVIYDGAHVEVGGPATETLTGFTACRGNIRNARAFSAYGDLQGYNSGIILNGAAPVFVSEDWWNYVDMPTTVTPSQTSATFGNNQSRGDCYNFCLAGLYWQSDCERRCYVECAAKADIKFEGCNPVQFTGNNLTGVPVASYYWDFGDGQTSTLQNPNHFYATGGFYTVCLTIVAVNAQGETCCDRVCTRVRVCDPQPCQIDPYFKTNDLGHYTVEFFDYSAGTGSACDWFWDFGDGNTSTLQNPVHSYAAPGVYYVCLKVTFCVYDAAGNVIARCSAEYCERVSVGFIISPNRTGKTGPIDNNKAMLFPNPTSSELFINAPEDMKPVIRVLNASGQQVLNAELSAKNVYKANVERLAAGVYNVEIVYANGTKEILPFVKN